MSVEKKEGAELVVGPRPLVGELVSPSGRQMERRVRPDSQSAFCTIIKRRPRVDLACGTIDDRRAALTEAVLPLLDVPRQTSEQYSVLVADFSLEDTSRDLIDAAQKKGHSIRHWDISTGKGGLLSELNSQELANVIIRSGGKELNDIKMAATSVLTRIAISLEMSDETGGVVTASIPQLHDGIKYLKGEDTEAPLENDQKSRLRRSISPEYITNGVLDKLNEHFDILRESEVSTDSTPLDYNAEKLPHLFSCSVPLSGLGDPEISSMLLGNAIPILIDKQKFGLLKTVVLAGADKIPEEKLDIINKLCRLKGINVITTVSNFSEETMKHIKAGQNGALTGFMKAANGPEADYIAQFSESVEETKVTGWNHSENKVATAGYDSGKNSSDASGSKSKGKSESRSSSTSTSADRGVTYNRVDERRLKPYTVSSDLRSVGTEGRGATEIIFVLSGRVTRIFPLYGQIGRVPIDRSMRESPHTGSLEVTPPVPPKALSSSLEQIPRHEQPGTPEYRQNQWLRKRMGFSYDPKVLSFVERHHRK
ncbi:MAG TPA: hypothetical protein VE090_04675 [Methylomirabilota bacterium]|nr:hypothetical protein [Methylomirabilota bacterium]